MMPRYDFQDEVLRTYHFAAPDTKAIAKASCLQFLGTAAGFGLGLYFMPPIEPPFPGFDTLFTMLIIAAGVCLALWTPIRLKRAAARENAGRGRISDAGTEWNAAEGRIFWCAGDTRQPLARFDEIAGIRLYTGRLGLYRTSFYAAIPRDPSRPSIRVSHEALKQEELECYADVLPWLEAAIARWNGGAEAPAAASDGGAAAAAAPALEPEEGSRAAAVLFTDDGWRHTKFFWAELLVFAGTASVLGLAQAWLAALPGMVPYRLGLGIVLLLALVFMVIMPVKMILDPAASRITVYSALGLRRQEFGFADVTSVEIPRIGRLLCPGFTVNKGADSFTLCMTCNAEKAQAVVREWVRLTHPDPEKVVFLF